LYAEPGYLLRIDDIDLTIRIHIAAIPDSTWSAHGEPNCPSGNLLGIKNIDGAIVRDVAPNPGDGDADIQPS
jgi:hypothetical protein